MKTRFFLMGAGLAAVLVVGTAAVGPVIRLLNDLADVNLAAPASRSDGNALVWSASLGRWTNGSASVAATNLTPWTSDINAATYSLTNVGNIQGTGLTNSGYASLAGGRVKIDAGGLEEIYIGDGAIGTTSILLDTSGDVSLKLDDGITLLGSPAYVEGATTFGSTLVVTGAVTAIGGVAIPATAWAHSVAVTNKAYDATTWNANTNVPTMDAVRDEMELRQPLDSDLTTFAGIGPGASGDIIIRDASRWTNLVKGTDGQVLKLSSGIPTWGTDSGGGGNWTDSGTTNAILTGVASLHSLTATNTVAAGTLTEGGNAVYNSSETPGGVLGGTWASPTLDNSLSVGSWTITNLTVNGTLTTTLLSGLATNLDNLLGGNVLIDESGNVTATSFIATGSGAAVFDSMQVTNKLTNSILEASKLVVTTNDKSFMSATVGSGLSLSSGTLNTATTYQSTNSVLTTIAGIGAGASGDIIIRDANRWTNLVKGADGKVLKLTSGIPSWETDSTASGNWTDSGTTNASLPGIAYAHGGVFTNSVTIGGTNVLEAIASAGSGGVDFAPRLTSSTGAKNYFWQMAAPNDSAWVYSGSHPTWSVVSGSGNSAVPVTATKPRGTKYTVTTPNVDGRSGIFANAGTVHSSWDYRWMVLFNLGSAASGHVLTSNRFWCGFSSSPTGQPLVSDTPNVTYGIRYSTDGYAGDTTFKAYAKDDNAAVTIDTGVTPALDTQYYVTFDKIGTNVYVYINGSKVATNNFSYASGAVMQQLLLSNAGVAVTNTIEVFRSEVVVKAP